MPCDLNKACLGCKADERLNCKHWAPSTQSKYYRCDYYFQYKLRCPFKEGTDCKTCQYHDASFQRGRPNETGINWNDPEAVKEYRRKRYARLREATIDPENNGDSV